MEALLLFPEAPLLFLASLMLLTGTLLIHTELLLLYSEVLLLFTESLLLFTEALLLFAGFQGAKCLLAGASVHSNPFDLFGASKMMNKGLGYFYDRVSLPWEYVR